MKSALVWFLVCITLLTFTIELHSQGYLWAKQAAMPGTMLPPPPYNLPPIPARIAVDPSGNVFVVSSFQGTAVFGSSNLVSFGSYDIFLAKYDSLGALQWVLQAGGNGYDLGSDVAVDVDGNAYITGTFQGTATFGSFTLSSVGQNIFVAKVLPNGTVAWASASPSGGQALGVAVDQSGNSFCTGSAGYAIVVEKRDALGNLLWHTEAVQEQNYNMVSRGWSVKVDASGNAFIAGQFNTTINFGTNVLSTYYFQAMFVAKLDPAGNFVWAKQAGSAPNDSGLSLALDHTGSPLVAGGFTGTIDFGITNFTTSGTDGFLAKYDSDGHLVWVRRISNNGSNTAWGVATDSQDNAFVSGYIFPVQAFFQKYDPTGNLVWGLYPSHGGSSISYGIAADSQGHAYAVTSCTGNISFDALSFTNQAGGDIFVSEISEQVPPIFTLQPASTPAGFMGGSNFTFAAAVRSVYPVTFQWLRNSNAIPGASNSSFTVTNAQISDQGTYWVTASNQFGQVTSTTAGLTVNFLVTVLTNGSGTASIQPSARYYPANTILTLRAFPATNAPFTGWTGTFDSFDNPLVITLTNYLLLVASFADSITNIVLDDLDPRVSFSGPWTSIAQPDMYETDFKIVPCSSVATANAIYRPTIVTAGYYDVSLWLPSVPAGSRAAPFSVVGDRGAFNTNVDESFGFGNWLVIAPGIHFDVGTNGVVTLSNGTGESASRRVVADAIRLLPSQPPLITGPPQNRTAMAGDTVTLQVTASGTTPFAYQWEFNGTNLSGATRSSLPLNPVRLRDAGVYRVSLSNVVGQAWSPPATLQVLSPAAPQLLSPVATNGQFRLAIQSKAGLIWSIENSSNLVDWASVTILTNLTGNVSFSEPLQTTESLHFYRASWVPE